MGKRSDGDTAEKRLRRILGAERFEKFLRDKHIEIPSPGIPGRTYLIDAQGTLNYRDKDEAKSGYNNWLCIGSVARESVLHEVANKILMILGDEDYLLVTANPQTRNGTSADRQRATLIREQARERYDRTVHNHESTLRRAQAAQAQTAEPVERRRFSLLSRALTRRVS